MLSKRSIKGALEVAETFDCPDFSCRFEIHIKDGRIAREALVVCSDVHHDTELSMIGKRYGDSDTKRNIAMAVNCRIAALFAAIIELPLNHCTIADHPREPLRERSLSQC